MTPAATWDGFLGYFGNREMNEPERSPNRIARFEVLHDLPGHCPAPLHFHSGHPTPWAEGLVVRFWNNDGTAWIGNFQRYPSLQGSKVIVWNEASAIVIMASGAFYLIDSANPTDYFFLKFVTGILFAEAEKVLFVAESSRIHAFGKDRQRCWVRENLGGYDVQLIASRSGILVAELEEEMGEARKTFRIRLEDGATI